MKPTKVCGYITWDQEMQIKGNADAAKTHLMKCPMLLATSIVQKKVSYVYFQTILYLCIISCMVHFRVKLSLIEFLSTTQNVNVSITLIRMGTATAVREIVDTVPCKTPIVATLRSPHCVEGNGASCRNLYWISMGEQFYQLMRVTTKVMLTIISHLYYGHNSFLKYVFNTLSVSFFA